MHLTTPATSGLYLVLSNVPRISRWNVRLRASQSLRAAALDIFRVQLDEMIAAGSGGADIGATLAAPRRRSAAWLCLRPA
jgi:hypothetical protein